MLNILIILIILCFIYGLITKNSIEGFYGQPIRTPMHLTLNNAGEPLYYDYQSPSANGELGCTVVPCPEGTEYNTTCWCCCNYH